MVDWIRPWVLLALPLLLAWWFWRIPGRQRALPHFLGASYSLSGPKRKRVRRELWYASIQGLRLAALVLLVLALAGPVAQRPRPSAPEDGLALVLALDLSGSMGLEGKGRESRLTMAKREMDRFVRARPRDRIGLVTFGEDALTRIPPTTAHAHLLEVLEGLEVRGPDEGTALGLGLGLAAYASLTVTTPSRVVVVLTDGRSNAGSVEPLSAARAAATLGVRIHTVGVGSFEGEDPLDETLLRTLAEVGGGRYFQADESSGLRNVLESLSALETGPVADRAGFDLEPLHRGLLILVLLLLGLEAALRTIPRGRVS